MKDVLFGMYHNSGEFEAADTKKKIEFDYIYLILGTVDEPMDNGEVQIGCVPYKSPVKVKTEDFDKLSNIPLDKIVPDKVRRQRYVVHCRYALNMFGKPLLDSVEFCELPEDAGSDGEASDPEEESE